MSVFPARLLAIASREEAERELARIGVDPCGIGMMSTKMLTRCVHLSKLLCRQANILKQEMMGLGGDAAVARGTVACSVDTTDVILMGTEKQLGRLCEKLVHQPFGLAGLADELTALLANVSQAPKRWRTARRDLALDRPLIMGILNATPDSFSDGGRFLDPHRAAERALEMEAEGADIIDIGGESTRPGAPQVPADEELRRILPVIEQLAGRLSCPISVDTWKGEVARGALAAGGEIINDISGFGFDPVMAQVAAESGAGVVLMHTRGTPDRMQSQTDYEDLLGDVIAGLRCSLDSAVSAGVERERIVIDPGIGFAKDAAANLEILRRLREFASLGLPLLVGTSRKSFIGKTLGRVTGERMVGTAATVALAVANGADILRVHDVRAMREAADMAYAIVTS
ncbi:dihydropteroate synthase [Oryzomonas sp.]|uniref:dihydropteroate synthase n=1 Tax=Oryzomonas sp. TaxID=2855186 RepID=UPI00285273AA|nr:dihydropteroate synthase [Oryzomonas sp.]